MSQTYTLAFAIPTSGISGGCMALHNSTASAISAVVVPFHAPTGTTAAVSIGGAATLSLRTREIKSASGAGLVGFS